MFHNSLHDVSLHLHIVTLIEKTLEWKQSLAKINLLDLFHQHFKLLKHKIKLINPL